MPDPLVRFAERSNPRRSLLLVSSVLGKHIPLPAARCRLAGTALGLRVAGDPRAHETLATLLDGDPVTCARLVGEIEDQPAAMDSPTTVLGFAETATALAEQVAAAVDADWWQTTTRVSVGTDALAFSEVHSHAPDHRLVPPPAGWRAGTMLLVDDELTTGATAARLIEAVQDHSPQRRYVVAVLVDARPANAGALRDCAEHLQVPIDVVALQVRQPPASRPAGWSDGHLPHRDLTGAVGAIEEVTVMLKAPAQHQGQDRGARRLDARAARSAAASYQLDPTRTLVVGTGEHLAFAQRFALGLGPEAMTSSTTRSPVLVSFQRGYPIRNGFSFANPDGRGIAGYAYNLQSQACDDIVVHFADAGHRRRGDELLNTLAAGHPRAALHVVTLERPA